MVSEDAYCSMSAERTYCVPQEIIPAASRSMFIADQTRGDLKRIKCSGDCPSFKLADYANAYKVEGDTTTVYESWYY